MAGKRIFSNGKARVNNVAKFLVRCNLENEEMRANIYETLRLRYKFKEATPSMLETHASRTLDAGGMRLLEIATLLNEAHRAQLRALLTVTRDHAL